MGNLPFIRNIPVLFGFGLHAVSVAAFLIAVAGTWAIARDISAATSFLDAGAPAGARYSVRPVVAGAEQARMDEVGTLATSQDVPLTLAPLHLASLVHRLADGGHGTHIASIRCRLLGEFGDEALREVTHLDVLGLRSRGQHLEGCVGIDAMPRHDGALRLVDHRSRRQSRAQVLPGRARTTPLDEHTAVSVRGLRTALSSAASIDGVESAAVNVRGRHVKIVIRTRRTTTDGLGDRVREAVESRLEELALARPPRVVVRVKARRGTPGTASCSACSAWCR